MIVRRTLIPVRAEDVAVLRPLAAALGLITSRGPSIAAILHLLADAARRDPEAAQALLRQARQLGTAAADEGHP